VAWSPAAPRPFALLGLAFLLGGDEERRDRGSEKESERDPDNDHDRAEDAAPSGVRDDVAVADGREHDERPPNAVGESGKVLAVDDRDEESDSEGERCCATCQVRKYATVCNSAPDTGMYVRPDPGVSAKRCRCSCHGFLSRSSE
jgi:hypothetical protein